MMEDDESSTIGQCTICSKWWHLACAKYVGDPQLFNGCCSPIIIQEGSFNGDAEERVVKSKGEEEDKVGSPPPDNDADHTVGSPPPDNDADQTVINKRDVLSINRATTDDDGHEQLLLWGRESKKCWKRFVVVPQGNDNEKVTVYSEVKDSIDNNVPEDVGIGTTVVRAGLMHYAGQESTLFCPGMIVSFFL